MGFTRKKKITSPPESKPATTPTAAIQTLDGGRQQQTGSVIDTARFTQINSGSRFEREEYKKDRSKTDASSASPNAVFNRQENSSPLANITQPPIYLRIPNELTSYSADCNDTSSGQNVTNLSLGGHDKGNVWYSGKDKSQATITITFSEPQQVHRYSLVSAGDKSGRNPSSWAFHGQNADNGMYELLHEVRKEIFINYHQQKDYDVTPTNKLYNAVQLRILECLKPKDGIHLNQFFVSYNVNYLQKKNSACGVDKRQEQDFDWTFGLGWKTGVDSPETQQGNIILTATDDDNADIMNNKFDADDHRSIRSAGSAFKAIKKRFSKFFVKGSSEVFQDPDFPANDESLFKIDPLAGKKGESTSPTDHGNLPAVQWRRPCEFMAGKSSLSMVGVDQRENPPVFGDKIRYDDIAQGQLGDCWLMCSLAAIAENDVLVRDLFDLRECNPSTGTYVVRLCKDGSWRRMVLDDSIPCVPGGGPLYSQCKNGYLWCMLIEKAFAKSNGSYAAIRTGFPYEAMIDLTGAPYKEFNLQDPGVKSSIDDGSLWRRLCKYDEYNYVMTLSTPGVDHSTEGGSRSGGGLVPGHAYSLIGVHEVVSKGLKLCKIRNPWGQFEWDGDWSDKSLLWTEETKRDFGWSDVDDGIFFMSFEDMVSRFAGINVCLVRHAGLGTRLWNEDRKKICYKFSRSGNSSELESVEMFEFKVKEDGAEAFLTVHQPDKRRIGSPDYFDIGITVLKKNAGGNGHTLVGYVSPSASRQHQLELNPGVLSTGTYLLVPTSTGCRIQQEKLLGSNGDFNRSCVLSIHCDKKLSLKEINFDRKVFDLALLLPVLADGERTDLFNDGSVLLFTLKSGYNGNTYVAQNNKPDLCAQIELDFSESVNIVTEKNQVNNAVTIPPSTSKIVHHVMPAELSIGWTCQWKCAGSFLSENEAIQSLDAVASTAAEPSGREVASWTTSDNIPSSLTNSWTRIHARVITITADKDQCTQYKQGREYVRNLLSSERQFWNKWFTGVGNDEAIITMDFSSPQQVDRYSLQSANEFPGRNPMHWKLLGRAVGATTYEVLHEEANAIFADFWEIKDYTLSQGCGVLYESMQLQILRPNQKGSGIQLGQIALWQRKDTQTQNKEDNSFNFFGLFQSNDNAHDSPQEPSTIPTANINDQAEENADDHRSIRSAGSAFKAIKKRFSKFFVKGSSEVFQDPDFPANDESLFKIDPLAGKKGESTSPTDHGNLPAVQWRRPCEFMAGKSSLSMVGVDQRENPPVFGDKIRYDDIAQGQLGDCWLMCSLAAIAENDVLVRDLFDLRECNPSTGTYVVRLCKDGSWRRMVLDDSIPCVPGGGPLYSQCKNGYLWCMLIEKAFAKSNGSYAAIRTGFPYEAMIDLTGAPYKEFNLQDPGVKSSIDDGSLWRRLCKYDEYNYVMTLSTPGVDHSTEGGSRSGGGLVPGHAYSLIGVHEVVSKGLKLCKIRNPWGQFEWDGDWSDKSLLWTEETKRDFGWSDVDDGIFFMSFEDMVSRFAGINVCLVRHAGLGTRLWNEDRKKICYKFSRSGNSSELESVEMFEFKVKEDGAEAFLTVHQPDKRRIGSPDYFDIGITVLKKNAGGNGHTLVGYVSPSASRQHQLELNPGVLSTGTYLLVPTSTGCRIQQERVSSGSLNLTASQIERCCVFTVHCDKKFTLNVIEFDKTALDSALKLPALQNGETSDLFHDGSVLLYTLKHGFSGNSYVVENRKKNMHVALEMDFSKSTNVVTVDGSLKLNEALIPPNESMLVRYVMPADIFHGWSCGWSCSGSFLTYEEVHQRKQKKEISTTSTAEPSTDSPSCGYSKGCVRIPASMLFYTTNHDENKSYPDGNHQFVHNLCEEGFENWNKWYSGPPNDSANFDGENVTITVRINPPQTIDRYSLISAGDNVNRAPRRWELWGQREGSHVSQWEELHTVVDAKFTNYFERKDFVIDDADVIDIKFCALQLRISASQKRGDGIQLSQLFFGTKQLAQIAAKPEIGSSTTWRPEYRDSLLINKFRLAKQKPNEFDENGKLKSRPQKTFIGSIFG